MHQNGQNIVKVTKNIEKFVNISWNLIFKKRKRDQNVMRNCLKINVWKQVQIGQDFTEKYVPT